MTGRHPPPRPMLAGIHIGLIIDADPEVAPLEQALAEQGASIERLHPGARRPERAGIVDLAIVRVGPRGTDAAGSRPAERQRMEFVQTLAHTERVIALLDEPPEASLGSLCEFVLPPFDPAEVIPRVIRLLNEPRPSPSLRLGNLELNVATRIVSVDGRVVDLTFNEFEIVHALLAANGGVLSREELDRRLGGDESAHKSRRIDIHIHRLRAKLRGMAGAKLETVRNVGYRLTAARPE